MSDSNKGMNIGCLLPIRHENLIKPDVNYIQEVIDMKLSQIEESELKKFGGFYRKGKWIKKCPFCGKIGIHKIETYKKPDGKKGKLFECVRCN